MAPSVNINLSAKIDLNISISLLSGEIVDVTAKKSDPLPIPMGFTESLALTNMSEEASESVATDLTSKDSEPVQCSSVSCLEKSDLPKKSEGPLTEEMFKSVAKAFASIFERMPSSIPEPCSSPLPRSSPSSPSFSDINPEDLFWIPLPEIELDDSVMEWVIDDEEMTVEIISCESLGGDDDDDVVFLKEVNRSGAKIE